MFRTNRARISRNVSTVALAAILASPAYATCTQQGQSLQCSDANAGGYTLDGVTASSLTLNAGGSISGGSPGAVTMATAISPNVFSFGYLNLTVNGAIDGLSNAGVSVQNGTGGASPFFGTTQAYITVGSGASITGSTGIRLSPSPGNPSGYAFATIVNSGSITATSGPALTTDSNAVGGFVSITNQSTGVIGGISGYFGSISNSGMIDGGSGSAVRNAGYAPNLNGNTVTNSGTIKSNSTAATLLFEGASNFSVTNSGSIANSGTGLAISAGNSLYLTSRGSIQGSILAAYAPAYVGAPGSTIDISGGGTVSGNITLAAGDDLVISDFNTTANPIKGVTGSVDAGTGNDTLQINFGSDTTLSAALTKPASFENLQYAVSNSAVLTLASGFTTPSTIVLTGTSSGGSVVNQANLTINGKAIVENSGSAIPFANQGTISAALNNPNDIAIQMGSYGSFTNSGTINVTGGRGVDGGALGSIVNSGSITADGTAVSLFSGALTNSGSIRSNGGIGAQISGSTGTPGSNSGSIYGATVGVQLFGISFVNTGTISSGGVAVDLSSYSMLDNRAGAVISGGPGFSAVGGAYNGRVTNAGTINGNVDLSKPIFTLPSGNTFIALSGGVLNGNLNLGTGGDLFVTNIVNNGPGQFAGVTGTVSGSGAETIRYIVDADATATLSPAGIFSKIGYELSNSASLKLSASSQQSLTVDLAGAGKVDLTADLSFTGDSSILNLNAQPAVNATSTSSANALDIVSHGTLTQTHVQPFTYAAPAVTLSTGSSFTNAGTIIARDLSPNPYGGSPLAAISGSGTVINSGTISVDGSVAVSGSSYSGALNFTNSGTINQVAGGADGQGVIGTTAITNSGSIVTGGSAIVLGGGYPLTVVTNSGTIQSLKGAAIVGPVSYGAIQGTITNLAGGAITGAASQPAIALSPGVTIDNAGSINGDVVLSVSPSPGYNPLGTSTYVNSGGTLNGNLTFGAGDDLLVSLNGGTGVTGTIDGGAGTDTFAQGYNTTVTVTANAALPLNFERRGIGAIGKDVVVTVTGPKSGLSTGMFLFGSGTIINQTDVNSAANPYSQNLITLGNSYGPSSTRSTLAFVNQATLADGVTGSVRSFNNSGTIGSSALLATAVSLKAADSDNFDFTNSGNLLTSSQYSCPYYYCYYSLAVTIDGQSTTNQLKTANIANSGTIAGSFSASINADDIKFDNSGTISSPSGQYYYPSAVYIYAGQITGYPPSTTDANANSVSIGNSGTLDGGINASVAARTTTFSNSGIVKVSNTSQAVTLLVGAHQTYDPIANAYSVADQDTVSFTNSGTIMGAVRVRAIADALTVTNSGTIKVPVAASPTILPVSYTGTSLRLESSADQSISFTNSGTITNGNVGASSVVVTSLAAAAGSSGRNPGDTPISGGVKSNIAIVNTGTLQADGGGLLVPARYIYTSSDYIYTPSALSAAAISDGASTLTITNGASGIISAAGIPVTYSPTGYQPAQGFSSGSGSVALIASADTVTVRNDGSITGGSGGVIPTGVYAAISGQAFGAAGETYLAGAIQTLNSADTVINGKTGVITGSIDLGAFDDRLENYGSIAGNVFLRDGNDTFVQNIGATFTGTADGGNGTDTLIIDITGGGMLNKAFYDRFVNFEASQISGTGTISTDGPLPVDSLRLMGGNLSIAAGSTLQTQGPTAITGDPLLANSVTNAGTIMGAIVLGAGNDSVVNTGTITGNVMLGDGNDLYAGGGTVTGNVDLGAGSDHLDSAAIGQVSGLIDGGTGTDSVDFTLTAANPASVTATLTPALFTRLSNFEQVTVSGTGTIQASGALPVDSIQLTGANLLVAAGTSLGTTGATTIAGSAMAESVTNLGTITGNIALGDGDDSLTTGGTIQGTVDLGAGNDRLIVTGAATFGAAMNGGSGNDTIQLSTSGTDAAPTQLNLSQTTAFETLQNSSGTNALSGTLAVDQVNVSGGRLIGRAGSTISGAVSIASGATFGSAGTVNGNISVNGTLSPGASPGTMTINGNVSLAGGSNTYFEMTPTVSDAIVINGSLAIATGSTLTLTGTRPLTPGITYDLITASNGITGTFSTVAKDSAVLGFVRQTSSAIQLLGTIQLAAGANPQVVRTTDYLNGLLIGATAPTALVNGLPALLSPTGLGNPVAIGRSHPEAYASASQIGIENGLALSTALRSTELVSREGDAGLFGFGQSFGNLRNLPGSAAAGTSGADISSSGVIGGLGYGSASAVLGGFIGYSNAHQRSRTLSTSTHADGLVLGILGQARVSDLDLAATFIWDGGKADTRRALDGGATAIGRYHLHGWTIDATAGYNFRMANGWTLRPTVGITHIDSRRSGTTESGAGTFNLDVAARTSRATFVSGQLMLKGKTDARVTPWLSAGMRHQLSGETSFATASLTGVAASFTVPGLARNRTLATAGGGLSAKLSSRLDAFASANGEFGAASSSANGTIGLRLSF